MSKGCAALPEVLERCSRHEDSSEPLALCAHSGPWYQVLCSRDAGEQGKGVIMSKACFALFDMVVFFPPVSK